MRYYRVSNEKNEVFLAIEEENKEGEITIVTSLRSFEDLANVAWLLKKNVDDIARIITQSQQYPVFNITDLIMGKKLRLVRPIDPPEIWGAGVTYELSKQERERESVFAARCYEEVYSAVRPEVFFKATASRCVGPFEEIGIRGDSTWNVPEPELAFVLYKGEIIGYSIGNDVCSRSIEGENPLYLPQAKIYARCCAIGPCIASKETIPNPHDLLISCEVYRNGKVVFRGQTSTARMVRRCEEIAQYVLKHNAIPDFTVVLTGTGIVPPSDFSLREGDIVRIMIERIGVLENSVVKV